MCSSLVSSPVDLDPVIISVPGTPTNCAEVIGLRLLAMLRQPEADYQRILNIWAVYTALRWITSPRQQERVIAPIIKNLPHEVKEDLAREVAKVNDAGSALLGKLLAEEGAVRTQPVGALQTGLRPGRALD
jgi:hypothetical protein